MFQPRFGSRFPSSIAALAVLGAVVWGGCGGSDDNRYYCDGDGCFQCDGYGCSEVAPPAKTACSGASSCAPGSVCTAIGCTTTCSDAVACPKGEICKAGLCAAPSATPGATKECTTKADCGEGKACVAGACQACGGTAGPCPCATTPDCSGGQVCVAGACTAPANACTFSSECGDGKLCADGQCLSSCASVSCAGGFTCDKGVCKPDGTAPVKTCTGDPECGTGNFCDQGKCVVDTRPKPNCTDDAQCGGTPATPKKCLGGFCKYTCTDDPYCKTIDNRIGFCAKDKVCRSEAEAKAQCLTATECTGGKACVDNQCK